MKMVKYFENLNGFHTSIKVQETLMFLTMNHHNVRILRKTFENTIFMTGHYLAV